VPCNAFALITGALLLGFGLVEIPRGLWEYNLVACCACLLLFLWGCRGTMVKLAIIASNAFALITGALLLGFGLVEIPRGLWEH